jgi:hypothetical protein
MKDQLATGVHRRFPQNFSSNLWKKQDYDVQGGVIFPDSQDTE